MANSGELLVRSLDRGVAVLGEEIADRYLRVYLITAGNVRTAVPGPLLLEPRASTSAYVFSGDKLPVGTIDTDRPVLRWKAWSPSALRSSWEDPSGRLAQASDVRYDVRIWRWESSAAGDMVYERRDVPGIEHTVETALPAQSSYVWAVRARFSIDGRDHFSGWGSALPASCPSPAFSLAFCGERFKITRAGPPPSASIPSPGAATSGAAAAAASPASQAAAPSSQPKIGDRWTYQLSDRGRVEGAVTIEIIDSSAAGVTERITRQGYPGFRADRQVEARFDPVQFQPPVTLRGGYQWLEIGPYLTPGMQLRIGQRWGPIPVEIYIPGFGKRSLATRVSVVNKSTVSVPAGEFDAWTLESEPVTVGTGGYNAVLTCTYWYSPQSLRTIKLQLDTVFEHQVKSTREVYELTRSESAK